MPLLDALLGTQWTLQTGTGRSFTPFSAACCNSVVADNRRPEFGAKVGVIFGHLTSLQHVFRYV